ncbi:MAG TPA: NBR1-Ig-like domain-containing protein [Anaerolineales bacterium]|nr:NBR1-Ig-like domain-containing protein [Anaerolineales bacterium]
MDENRTRILIGIGVAAALLVLCLAVACAGFYFLYPVYFGQPASPGPEALYTQAAETVAAQLTQGAATTATPTGTGMPASATAVPSSTSTNPPPPSATSLPPTPVPPTATPTPIPCNWAKYIEDVTVKDGTVFTPGTSFVKTWRLKNIGSCTWSRDYLLVFAGGEQMDGPKASMIDETVDPGETVDISVELEAPDRPGRYRGYWQLSTPGGAEFGIGADQEDAFWVEISVADSGEYPYDFAVNYCAARWSSQEGRLDCPGDKGNDDGFVILVDNPEIEINRLENEPALWTVPDDDDDGYIRGEYPPIEIDEDQRFSAVVGCLSESPDCDVIFQLRYRVGNGEERTLFETREVFDDLFTKVDIDLSEFEGEDVQFILVVRANGDADDDNAFWMVPRIID